LNKVEKCGYGMKYRVTKDGRAERARKYFVNMRNKHFKKKFVQMKDFLLQAGSTTSCICRDALECGLFCLIWSFKLKNYCLDL
jgi:hypothetical protein